MFPLIKGYQVSFLAWTTTPWTLPSNTALAVGPEIDYVCACVIHPIYQKPVNIILAQERFSAYIKGSEVKSESEIKYDKDKKTFSYFIRFRCKGKDLEGLKYEQLLTFVKPEGKAFEVLCGEFVTTEDGTGIVHIAPSFGADDFKVAKKYGIAALTLVDKRGRFLPEVSDGVFLFGDEYVKEAYLTEEEKKQSLLKQKETLEKSGKIKELKEYLSVDERIVLKLQSEGKLFKKEIYEHNYPHCWRTDKPVLYYPLDSWFVKTTACKERMVELNKTIRWKPEATGTGRFGHWLENLNDWNLSRSRFWGIPIPIWTSEDGQEQICIGSVEELYAEIQNAISKGFMKENPLKGFVTGDFSNENYARFDLHKPYVDEIVLEKNGKKLFREPDLLDVWFDSGAMPYAQWHYPFENKDYIDSKIKFPADFIAEGVDQTRGWFYTLHAISAMVFDSVAFKNVVSNGLVLDKNGNKMSKRLGNAVDPFDAITKYGPDAIRWYMISNAAPWENLKFDISGVQEVQRKFFGTLFNTYSFFALYANVDNYSYSGEIPLSQRTEMDRWIISCLHSLIKNVEEAYENFEPHRATRFMEFFLDDQLSNWYVRLSRKRFWKGELTQDKKAAYETLYECLLVLSKLISPVAPFFSEWLYQNLRSAEGESVHLSSFPAFANECIDRQLEKRMDLAMQCASMALSVRKREKIKVRQPLQKIKIALPESINKEDLLAVKDVLLSEINVKEMEIVDENDPNVVKTIKPNFKLLGKKLGPYMKLFAEDCQKNAAKILSEIASKKSYDFKTDEGIIPISEEEIEVVPVDLPGWKVVHQNQITIALDVQRNENLIHEGLARELVNRVQNIRKDSGFEVTDKIRISIEGPEMIKKAVEKHKNYICGETLAENIIFVQNNEWTENSSSTIELDENLTVKMSVKKI
ncbi:MAG: isoleucine--tRNA ligase [Bacteroidia bacterium]|nr:isoleucine--tRNA ligase [Bacteroidia bacterium]